MDLLFVHRNSLSLVPTAVESNDYQTVHEHYVERVRKILKTEQEYSQTIYFRKEMLSAIVVHVYENDRVGATECIG